MPSTQPPTAGRPRLAGALVRIARRLAEESVILLSNDGMLPLERAARVALIGPNAGSCRAL